jgi:NNP family nitrate/nitrite transporter-like MFS transporter
MPPPHAPQDLSWRLTFLLPLAMHIFGALFVLSGRDLPDGNFKELELSGAKQKSQGGIVTKVGLSNVNAWLLTISYGFCFGIELTMNNIAASFFGTYFGLDVVTAGVLASVFGMVNLFARSLGGITSDWAAGIWGMRGRIWQLWFWQSTPHAPPPLPHSSPPLVRPIL